MRILDFKMKTDDSKITITGSKTPNLTSTGGDDIIDIVNLDLGTVTPTGTVDIETSFYVRKNQMIIDGDDDDYDDDHDNDDGGDR